MNLGQAMIVSVAAFAGLGAAVGFAPSQVATLAAATTTATTASNAATFEVDTVHSSAVFRIMHAGASPFYGLFTKLTGTIMWDKAAPESTTMEIIIDAESVSSGNGNRDGHLRNPDFFNAKQFPTITFKSTSLKKTGENTFDLAGDLTLLGKTKPITAKLVVTGERDAGGRFGYRVGMDATFTIKRTDFGMSYGVDQGSLGDEVTLMVGFAGVRK
jgi:polyisoprenoid-binding protein YceI